MSWRLKIAGEYAIVALVALAFTALPGGGPALTVVGTLLSIAFFTAIAVFGYRLHRQFRFELSSLTDGQRLVLYGSIGLALLTFCATQRMFDAGGAGVGAWFALLAMCSYGLYWTWTQYRSYA